MIIKPKVRGFVCITAHPDGCEKNVLDQIETTKKRVNLTDGPKKVLVIGSSTGYGLSSRITAAFGSGAATIGVYFERPPANNKPASPGWYNARSFDSIAIKSGLYAKSINGDAFSDEVRQKTIDLILQDLKTVDLVIYSLASPRRTIPGTKETFKSVLKPIGSPFSGKTLNTDKNEIHHIAIDPASEDEIEATKKVMGGEDWELWIEALSNQGCLSKGCKTVAYSYIGPEVTWPIYKNGTIGKAKEHLDISQKRIQNLLESIDGNAWVSVNKAVITQASSAIPVVPLYLSALIKIMKKKGIEEGCIEQINRLFTTSLYAESEPILDSEGRIRVDDWEMREDVQNEIKEIWSKLSTDTLYSLTDYDIYQNEFLKLFGFNHKCIDYSMDVAIN